MDANTVKKHRSDDIFLINSSQGCDCIIVGSTFFQQNVFCSSISLDNIEIGELFTEETSSFRINLDDLGINATVF